MCVEVVSIGYSLLEGIFPGLIVGGRIAGNHAGIFI
jgi:hypothetical protein